MLAFQKGPSFVLLSAMLAKLFRHAMKVGIC
jgi:hypothetical protein